MFCPLAWLRSAALHIVWITKDLRHTKHLTFWLSVVSLALTLTLTLTLTHSNEYNSSLETRNYVSRHNNDRGTLNASYCIFCQNVLTAGLKLGFMEIQTLNGGWCIYQAFSLIARSVDLLFTFPRHILNAKSSGHILLLWC